MRLKSLVLGALVTAGLVVTTGGSASAAGQCSIVVPSKVTIDHPYREVVTRLAPDCQAAGVTRAAWDIVHPTQGLRALPTFSGGATTDSWDVYDSTPTGVYTVRTRYAFTADYETVDQNTTSITVKLGARLTATAKRAGGKLTLSTTAKVYSPKASTWAGRSKAKVSLMHQAPGSTTWKYVKSATATSSGRVSLTVVPKAGQYRLAIGETASVWAVSSNPVRGR